MENKQTSIEWLVANIDWQLLKNTTTHYDMIVEQAKEMHKQEIEDAYIQGFAECDATGIMDVDKYLQRNL